MRDPRQRSPFSMKTACGGPRVPRVLRTHPRLDQEVLRPSVPMAKATDTRKGDHLRRKGGPLLHRSPRPSGSGARMDVLLATSAIRCGIGGDFSIGRASVRPRSTWPMRCERGAANGFVGVLKPAAGLPPYICVRPRLRGFVPETTPNLESLWPPGGPDGDTLRHARPAEISPRAVRLPVSCRTHRL